MKSVEIDRSKRLIDQPKTGHNRWHPDVTPILEADEGEEVVLETRDGVDGQLGRRSGQQLQFASRITVTPSRHLCDARAARFHDRDGKALLQSDLPGRAHSDGGLNRVGSGGGCG